MTKLPDSPYITNPNRLADVIAAIQAMAVFELHMRNFKSWSVSISGDESKADHWKRVFEEHPEFFRIDTSGGLASLVWRRQLPKTYHVGRQQLLSKKTCEGLSADEKRGLVRPPLTPNDIKTLIDTAINIHASAVELKRESKWWVPLAGAGGGFAGSLVGAFLRYK